ncbi:MAG: hypothetical protein R3337_09965 [Gammaproteobacteria bacterium]|nr:hypothetical protein [Gammaproteobacteria bacterium]
MAERRLAAVPRAVVGLLALALLAQLGWHGMRANLEAVAETLPPAPSAEALRLVSLGDPIVFAKTLMLWLQAHDNQPGVSIPFRALDYTRVQRWLDRILELDPKGQYPLLAASRIYGAVSDERRKRMMLEFVYERFLDDPDRRWRWLAHAAIVAKHQLKDPQLALKYARAITDKAQGDEVPAWARDMTVIVLEDMGELEDAKFLIGGLIHSGRVTDPHEIRFLEKKLEELEEKTTVRDERS